MQSPKAKWSSVVVAKGTTVHFQAGGRAAWTPKFANVITPKKSEKVILTVILNTLPVQWNHTWIEKRTVGHCQSVDLNSNEVM